MGSENNKLCLMLGNSNYFDAKTETFCGNKACSLSTKDNVLITAAELFGSRFVIFRFPERQKS